MVCQTIRRQTQVCLLASPSLSFSVLCLEILCTEVFYLLLDFMSCSAAPTEARTSPASCLHYATFWSLWVSLQLSADFVIMTTLLFLYISSDAPASSSKKVFLKLNFFLTACILSVWTQHGSCQFRSWLSWTVSRWRWQSSSVLLRCRSAYCLEAPTQFKIRASLTSPLNSCQWSSLFSLCLATWT